MKKINVTCLAAILCVAGLEGLAILKGMDGSFFGVVIAVLAGLGGYQVGLNTPTPPQN
jgi:hypothetical protein